MSHIETSTEWCRNQWIIFFNRYSLFWPPHTQRIQQGRSPSAIFKVVFLFPGPWRLCAGGTKIGAMSCSDSFCRNYGTLYRMCWCFMVKYGWLWQRFYIFHNWLFECILYSPSLVSERVFPKLMLPNSGAMCGFLLYFNLNIGISMELSGYLCY